jgi:predicted GIY-YIG superfamily endonuclease
MPRLPIDYANTIIYKIVCNDLNITECYVGHTTDFVRRKKSHKHRCITETDKKHNLKVYKII